MRPFGFVLLAMFLTSDSSPQQPPTPDIDNGNGLLEVCADGAAFHYGLCMGYITGVLDGANTAPIPKNCPAPASYWCIPKGVTLGQIQEVVVKYLKDHPEIRHQPSNGLIENAVLAVWSCPK